MTSIDRLRSLTISVTNLKESLQFYTEVWGLVIVEDQGHTVFLRAAGTEHHVLALSEQAHPGLVSITFGVADQAALHALHDALLASGVPISRPPRELSTPGGGLGFALNDPDGRTIKIVADRDDHERPEVPMNRPVALAHVVFNSPNADASADWYMQHFGLRLSDQTRLMHFLRCNSNHHAIAVAKFEGTAINHIAFEMASWNELMFGVGRLKEAGVPVQWGVGRHGPGDNVFAYFLDPDGLAIEYTAEVQQIDEDTHRPGTPEDWIRPTNRMDQWGHSNLATPAMESAMRGFSQQISSLSSGSSEFSGSST